MNTIPNNIDLTTLRQMKAYIYKSGLYTLSFNSIPLPEYQPFDEDFVKFYGFNFGITEDPFGKKLFFDPNHYEFEEFYLPVYVHMFEIYRNIGKEYSFKEYTKETIDAAWNLYDSINCKKRAYDDYFFCKDALNGGVICLVSKKLSYGYHNLEGEPTIFEFPIYSPISFYNIYSILVDTTKIKPKDVLELNVPENIAGLVIGRHGCNLKELSACLDLKYIKVTTCKN